MTRKRSNRPTWGDIKAKLREFDRPGLLGLIQALYEANPENRLFLQSRLNPTADVLQPYKKTISRWVYPDGMNQDVSVAKAKKAVADYKKAVGDPLQLADLMVFYCEEAINFSVDVGMEGDSWFNAILIMFRDALRLLPELPQADRNALLRRLEDVTRIGQDVGYGVGAAMNYMMSEYEAEIQANDS